MQTTLSRAAGAADVALPFVMAANQAEMAAWLMSRNTVEESLGDTCLFFLYVRNAARASPEAVLS